MKNVIITGGNSGLGFETAKKIAKNHDFRIILACRNLEKGELAKEEIIKETENTNIDVMKIDTSSLSSVRAFTEEYLNKYQTVDVLINNAGISAMRENGLTPEGFEIVFATNYLGHFLLTNLFINHFSTNGKIINITSDMHNPPGGLEWQGVDYFAYKAVDDRKRYSFSKLAMIYLIHKLNEIINENKLSLTANSFNPGFMSATNFSGGGGKGRDFIVKTTMPERYGKLETSSDALAEIVTNNEFDNVTDKYFDRSTNTKDSSDLSYVKENWDELWEKSLGYCNLK